MPFTKQLEKLNISTKTYLEEARMAAKKAGYNPDKLNYSTKHNKKLQYETPTGQIIHFGAYGYGDYLIYKKTNPAIAEEKRRIFQSSHSKIPDSGKYSANQLALRINW